MGKILTDVLRLKEEGLVGFTEIGEQVLLEGPILNIDVGSVFPSTINKRTHDILEETDNETYVHFEIGKTTSDSLHYRFYRARE